MTLVINLDLFNFGGFYIKISNSKQIDGKQLNIKYSNFSQKLFNLINTVFELIKTDSILLLFFKL